MKHKGGQKLIDELKEQGFELDWDWGEENHAALSKTEGDEILMIEIYTSVKGATNEMP